MSKTATILFALCTLFCSACSWVDDDRSDCPTGCWLKLSYTYNMLNVDAVTTQVKDVTLFILDQEGNYIVREEVDSLTFHQNECTIQVPSCLREITPFGLGRIGRLTLPAYSHLTDTVTQ